MNDKELIELLKEKTITDILTSKDLDEDLFYRLSSERGNVLSCIDFNKEDDVLEYSFECHSLSFAYLDKVNSATKITTHKEVQALVYGDKVKCIEEIDDRKYSKIILNGVLDYLGENESRTLIETMKNHLYDNGEIIITLTNKYSIKLLSGAKQYGENEYFTSLRYLIRTGFAIA